MARKRTLAKVTAKTGAAAAETAKVAAEKTETVKEAVAEKTETVKEAVAETTEAVTEAVKEAAEKTVKTAKRQLQKERQRKRLSKDIRSVFRQRSGRKGHDCRSEKRLDKGKWKKSRRHQRNHSLCKAGGGRSLLCSKWYGFRKSGIRINGTNRKDTIWSEGRYGIFFLN